MDLITLIVPCYNEQESLPLFRDEVMKVTSSMTEEYKNREDGGVSFEFLFINDGSKDDTLSLLRKLSEEDERVRYLSFSRNFGKEAAMIAGLEHSKGDYCVILDADLQHPPSLIPEMYRYVKYEGYDCAATRRVSRKGEPALLSFFSRSFYKVINSISDTYIIDGAQDFRFMTRQMVDSIISMPEYHRFSKGIFSWVGYETKFIPIENVERAAGRSTWNFQSLFRYSLEGIFAFSTMPLTLASHLGIIFCIFALIMIIVTVVKKLVFGEDVSGYPTIICLVSLLGGTQLFSMGIMGNYLAKMYIETKGRPKYIVKEDENSHRDR